MQWNVENLRSSGGFIMTSQQINEALLWSASKAYLPAAIEFCFSKTLTLSWRRSLS